MPRLAERFELYVCGVELANGCGELVDAGEQRGGSSSRWRKSSASTASVYPIDEDFLAALATMPAAAASRSASSGW